MYKVFDVHTHTYPEAIAAKAAENLGKFYDIPVQGKGTYDDLEEQAAACHVRGFLLFSVATNPIQVQKVNTSIAALAEHSRKRGFMTVGYAGMHQDYADFDGELERARVLGLRGVKIHPDIQEVDIDDPRLLRLYEVMEGRMPLYLHMGDDRPQYRFSEAEKLVRVMRMFPRLEVVAAHLGGYRAWDDAVRYLTGRENLWFDTSSALWVLTPEEALRIILALGTERVMFGTDYPVVSVREELDRFLALKLSEHEREDILWHNAVRFFHLEEEAASMGSSYTGSGIEDGRI